MDADDIDRFMNFSDLDDVVFESYDVEDVDWPIESWKKAVSMKVRKR